MKEYSSVYSSRHVAVTMGNDFTYTVASAWFKNMDKLIKYVSSLTLGIVSSPQNIYTCIIDSTSDFLINLPLKLILLALPHFRYTNNHSTEFNLLYSTPSCYLQAINAQNLTWPSKEDDDFFPYASDEHSYWTGYFTSRPAFKYFVYLANNILQVCYLDIYIIVVCSK